MNGNWDEILQREQKLEAKEKPKVLIFVVMVRSVDRNSFQCRVSEFSKL